MLDRDLAGDVGAAEGFVWGKPGSGVRVGFLLVGETINGEKIHWVISDFFSDGFVEILSAGLPGI